MVPAPIRLAPADAQRYATIRRQMLEDAPWAYEADPNDDRAQDMAFLQAALSEPENAIFAVETVDARSLVAVAGIYRMKSPKFSHRAKLWGVFVEPGHRRLGLGLAVTSAALQLARSWHGLSHVDVGVSENSPRALNLYRVLGFVEWGREPGTTLFEGKRYDEIFLSLNIESPTAPRPDAP